MIKNIILYSNNAWHKNVMDTLRMYDKSSVIIFEDVKSKEDFLNKIQKYNKNRLEDDLDLIPYEFDSFIVPTEGSLLHRRLRSLKLVVDTLSLNDDDRIMFMDEDDKIDMNENAINKYTHKINPNIIFQLSRIDYSNIYPESIGGPWNVKENEWIHYTLHPYNFKKSILYSYNYNFTGKLFSVKLIREWLNKEYDNLMNMGKMMQQEDLIMMISLVNFTGNLIGYSNLGKYGIYKYNYISKYRQDPSKNPIILNFIDKNITKEFWGIDAKDFPFKNKSIAILNNYSTFNNERCCYLTSSYDYPWEIDIVSKNYIVVYNKRYTENSDLYRIMIEKSKKYNLDINLEG